MPQPSRPVTASFSGPQPLSAVDVSDLLNVNLSLGLPDTARNNESECAICQQQCQDTDILLQHQPCLHCFHASDDCSLRWIRENLTCPMCRSPIRRTDRSELVSGEKEWQAYWNKRATQQDQDRPGYAEQEQFQRSIFVARAREHIDRSTAERLLKEMVQNVEWQFTQNLDSMFETQARCYKNLTNFEVFFREYFRSGRPLERYHQQLEASLGPIRTSIEIDFKKGISKLKDEHVQHRLLINEVYDNAIVHAEQNFRDSVDAACQVLVQARSRQADAHRWEADPPVPKPIRKDYRALSGGVRGVSGHCPEVQSEWRS